MAILISPWSRENARPRRRRREIVQRDGARLERDQHVHVAQRVKLDREHRLGELVEARCAPCPRSGDVRRECEAACGTPRRAPVIRSNSHSPPSSSPIASLARWRSVDETHDTRASNAAACVIACLPDSRRSHDRSFLSTTRKTRWTSLGCLPARGARPVTTGPSRHAARQTRQQRQQHAGASERASSARTTVVALEPRRPRAARCSAAAPSRARRARRPVHCWRRPA